MRSLHSWGRTSHRDGCCCWGGCCGGGCVGCCVGDDIAKRASIAASWDPLHARTTSWMMSDGNEEPNMS